MFTTLIVKPIFNLLVLILGLLPGHNFGLSIIIFTVLVRLLMWPLVKKQLHQAKAMRELQPELKKIKKAAAGNKQKESQLMMELYKEKEINPFSSIGLLVVQIPVLIGLYSGVHRIVDNPKALVDFSYSFINSLPWLKTLATDISKFDHTLFGIVDLTRPALGKSGGGVYIPALIIVLASVVMQYFQAVQLMPQDDEKRKLRDILKSANAGKPADSSEVNAAVASSTKYILPFFILIVTVNIASALSLYLLVSGAVAFIQQSSVLNQDKQEMSTASKTATTIEKNAIEAEVVTTSPKNKKNNKNKKNKGGSKKRKK